jgi:hypothetical protein
VVRLKDLSPNQRLVMESILGRSLRDDESLTIRASSVVQEEPTGVARVLRFKEYRESLDRIADRVKSVPEDEIDAAIDELPTTFATNKGDCHF